MPASSRRAIAVRIDGDEIGTSRAQLRDDQLVYPQIEDGRVVADAVVDGLGDYFVSERIRVWVSGGERTAFIVPASFISTRFGIDYARVCRRASKARSTCRCSAGAISRARDMPDASRSSPGSCRRRLVRP